MDSDAAPLTVPDFWDDFWKKVELPVYPDAAKSYERTFMDIFDRFLEPNPAWRAFEVGGAPGMWLAYLHKRFGYRVFGCDTSPKGVALTRENFRRLGIPGELAEQDLFDYRPQEPFDVILSMHFIEHFEDPTPVTRRTVELLRPGGLFVLSVPNLVGFNAWLSKPEFLAAHNARTMRLTALEGLARDCGLATLWAGYHGGFEPDLVGPPRAALLRRAVLKALRILRRLPAADSLDSPLWSGFITGVFRKPR